MSLYSPIPCQEIEGTKSLTYSDGGLTASVSLMVDWSLAYTLAADLYYNARPWPYAFGPRVSSATVRDFNCEASAGQCIIGECSIVDVTYDMEDREECSESLAPATQFQTQDYRRFRWGSPDGQPLIEAEAPGRLVCSMELVRTLFRVPGPLPLSILTLKGHVNAAPFVSNKLGLVFDTDTLLYAPPSLSRTITSSGTAGWDITFRFLYQEGGWNSYWRPETQAYEPIYLYNGGQYFNYPQGNFAPFLF